jgi:flagellar biosynthetic protein FlhB
MLIPALIIMVVNVISLLAQHGVIYSPQVIMPKLERISPIAGFKRIFSLNSVVELIKGLIKLTIVSSIFYVVLKEEMKSLIFSHTIPITSGLILLLQSLTKLFISVCCFMFFLAIADFIYQRFSYINKMKMSKKELKDEHKEQEGSPEVKSKLKAMRARMSRQRVMAAVPNADVVITNPTHYAVALEYKNGNTDVRIVVAKGQDNIALLIRSIAEKNKIPIVQNPPLARLLYSDIEIGMPIKEKHYKAVAEVIAYVIKLQRKQMSPGR